MDSLDHRMCRWLAAIGGVCLPVPNNLGLSLQCWLDAIAPAAIILTGGNDIGEALERDLTETALLEYALQWGLPVIGICRGMQMLAHFSGVDLVGVEGHTATRHALRVLDSVGNDLPSFVNSYHNWAIRACPEGYRVLATSGDGTIEAIQHLDRPWHGLMWHPERELVFDQKDIFRIKELIL